jgi:hypothetical protein
VEIDTGRQDQDEPRRSLELDKRIDELIEAGWGLATDFDDRAFLDWKKRSQECLAQLLDEEHPHFELFWSMAHRSLQEPQSKTLPLIGVLEAVKHRSLSEGVYRLSSLQ